MLEGSLLKLRSFASGVGVLASLVLAPVAPGQTAHFARTTDTVALAGNTTLGFFYTFEAVVLLESSSPAGGRLFSEQANAQEDKALSITTDSISGGVWDGFCTDTGAGVATPVPTGRWIHIALVRDSGQFRLYVDGVIVRTVATPCSSRNDAASNMSIGAFPYTASTFVSPSFVGYLDWVRISSIARYSTPFVPPACEPSTDAGTLILLKFNDAPGTTNVAVEGSAVSAGVTGTGFPGATAPVFGPAPVARTPDIAMPPSSVSACPGSTARLTIAASGAGPLTYQWRKGTSNINTTTNPSAATPTLELPGASSSDAAVYSCVVSNACGSATSAGITLNLGCGSIADIVTVGGAGTCDNQLTADDIIAFLAGFFNQQPISDVARVGGALGRDGQWTADDVIAFLAAFFAGCPA